MPVTYVLERRASGHGSHYAQAKTSTLQAGSSLSIATPPAAYGSVSATGSSTMSTSYLSQIPHA
jgi:hypothetical protein